MKKSSPFSFFLATYHLSLSLCGCACVLSPMDASSGMSRTRRRRYGGVHEEEEEEEGSLYAIPMYLWEEAFDAVWMDSELDEDVEGWEDRRREVDRLTAASDRCRWAPGRLYCSRRFAVEFWRRCGLLRLSPLSPKGWKEMRVAGRVGRSVGEAFSHTKSFGVAIADLLEGEDFFKVVQDANLSMAVHVEMFCKTETEGSLGPVSFAVGVPWPAPHKFAASLGELLRTLVEKSDGGAEEWYMILDVAVVRKHIAAAVPIRETGWEREDRASFFSSMSFGRGNGTPSLLFSDSALRSAWIATSAADPSVPVDTTSPSGILKPALRR